MSKLFTQEAQQLIRSVRDSSLLEINFNETVDLVKLVFSFAGFAGGEGHEVILSLGRLTTITLNPPDRGSFPSLVADIEVLVLEDAQGQQFFRLHLEGEIEIKADAKYIQLHEEIIALE